MITGPVTYARGASLLFLTAVCDIQTSTVTDDSGGGGSVVWATSVSTVCRVDPLTGGEGEVAARISDRSTHLLTFLPETAVSVADRVDVDGVTYEVTAVRSATGEQARFVEVVQVT